jgi:hypothetical protein
VAGPVTASARQAISIAPASGDVNTRFNALYVGSTGNLDVTTIAGSRVTFMNVPVGFFPVAVSTVHQAATTAGNLIGLTW